MRGKLPLIGVISDRRMLGRQAFQLQGEKYLDAVVASVGGYPVGLPCLAGFDGVEGLARLDGLLLTGSPSNVEPHRYGAPTDPANTLHDPARDEAVFALIPAAVRYGLPLLAICRGFQELNVAFGGSLHQQVHAIEGLDDHREDRTAPLEVQYAPVHEVRFTPGGMLQAIAGVDSARVNSVHHQGVDRLGEGLCVEATAPDGLIEALSVRDAPGFVLGVPEVFCMI